MSGATVRQAGVEDLHYLPGDPFLAEDGEGTIGGSHPTDLGMTQYANAYDPVLRSVLE